MRNKPLKFILILSLALNVSMLSAAGYFFYRHHRRWNTLYGGASRREMLLLESVPLRPDQIKTLQEKSAGFYAMMDRKRGEITDLRKVLFFLLFTDRPDRRKINDIVDEINTLQKETQTAVAEHILEEKAVMDEKQREKFYEMLEKSLNKRMHMAEGSRD